MIEKSFDAITFEDIQTLVDNGVSESRTLDYKQALPGNSDDDKREFLADISSFGNAAGGDIIYGIVEKRDTDGKCTGVPEKATGLAGLNIDAEKLRIENIVRTGVEPRIPVLQIRTVDGFMDGPVVLIRIQQSWLLPHMVTFKNYSRFYSRNSAGKYQLDVTELRSSFLQSEGKPERVRRFRDERLSKIIANDTSLTLIEGAKIILHVVPLAGLETTSRQQVSLATASKGTDFKPMYATGWDCRYNLDGIINYDHDNSGLTASYVQLFRNGALESVIIFDGVPGRLDSNFELEIINHLNRYLRAEKMLSIEPPFIIMLSLIGVKDWIVSPHQYGTPRSQKIDRDYLLLPDIILEDFNTKIDVALRPIFDALWQASGWPQCIYYDDEGRHR